MGEGFLSGRWRGFGRVMLACLGVALFVGRAFGAAEPRTDGETYTVSAIQFVLPSGVADFPTEADLDRLQIVLADAPGGKAVPQSLEQEYRQTELRETFNEKSPYVAWPPVPESVVAIGDIGKGGAVAFHRSGLWALEKEIAQALNDGDAFGGREFIGVYVGTDENDIAADGADHRNGRTTLRLVIELGHVGAVRTIAFGERVGVNQRINNPLHDRIRLDSPVGPASQPSAKTDVLRKDLIDDYLFHLDRQPGTKVDVAVSAAASTPGAPPEAVLDYLVTENKPWFVYAQASNTGTRQTSAWRYKFGFVDNQLLNDNDIFSIDYSFATPNSSEEWTSSYELPLSEDNRVRGRVYGSADKFVASDVGFSSEDFHGTEQMLGAEVSYNFFQYHQLFIDAFGGYRYQHFHVTQFENGGPSIASGAAGLEMPYGGLRLARITDPVSTVADVTAFGGITDRNKSELQNLGRLDPARNFFMLQSDVDQSFYLEPIFKALGLPYKEGTLANEIVFYGRYQETFGSRLIPEEEQTAGGFYTVRGYQESAVAGDRALIGTAEYRFHLPRWLDAQATPGTLLGQPFRYAPQQDYGQADWDLIFRSFFDAARVEQVRRESYENDDTLLSTGVGLELQVRQNLDIRADWGVALKPISDGTTRGSNRFHLSMTLLY